MPRTLRIEYPDAVYHLVSRGDRRERIFVDGVDRQSRFRIGKDAGRRDPDPVGRRGNYPLGFFDDTGSYHDCPLWRILGHELCGHALFRLGNEDQEIVPTATKLSESKTVLPASTALQRVDFTWIYGRANPLGDAQMEKLSISGPSPGSRYPAADAQPTTN